VGVISVIFGSQSHYGFITAREMKHTSQYGSDKTTDGKMAQISPMLFSEFHKTMVKKVFFVGFKGSDRPNRSPGYALAAVWIIFAKILNVLLASKYSCLVQLFDSLVQLFDYFFK